MSELELPARRQPGKRASETYPEFVERRIDEILPDEIERSRRVIQAEEQLERRQTLGQRIMRLFKGGTGNTPK